MYDRSLLNKIRNFEMAMGHTHICLKCRRTFLAHEDGCPNCGIGAPTRFLYNKMYDQECSDKNVLYWLILNEETGNIKFVRPGDSCPWPRSE